MNQKTRWLLAIVAVAFGCLIGFFQIHNADVWWHIAWGEEMLRNLKAFPSAEHFYFTPISAAYLRDLPNTFLGDMGLALLYKVGGVLGLQLLVLICLFLGGALVILFPLGKEMLQRKSSIYLTLLLFFAFCLGTSQLQLVRNSLASLLLFPLVLGLYSWHVRHGGWKMLLFYPGIFLTWSFLHSSYILGIISLLLLYGGLFLEVKRKRSLSRGCLLVTLFLLLGTMSLSLTYSWQARQLLTASATHGWEMVAHVVKKREPSKAAFSATADPASSLNSAAIKPLWGNEAVSGDFIETWKILRHPAAWSSLFLSGLALLALMISRSRNKIGMLSLLVFTTYFGICYFRGTGYAAIVATFTIATVCGLSPAFIDEEKFKKRFAWVGKAIIPLSASFAAVALLGAIYLVIAKKSEFFFMERGRVFAVGKAAVFEDASYNFVKTHFFKQPCFTTMVTGSYALVNWKEEKKVFLDAFFAPHPSTLWNDYHQAIKGQNLSCLDQYGIQVAIIENSRIDWQSLFLSSPEWRPIAIGLGATVYAKGNSSESSVPIEVLFTLNDVQSAPSVTTRHAAAATFYNSILALQLKGEGTQAAILIKQHADLFKNLVNSLSFSQRGNIRQEPPGIKPVMLTP